MSKEAYVYILSNRVRGTLYVGVTSNLQQRLWQHKSHAVPGFTDRYNLNRLVWFVSGESIRDAIHLEKKIKNRGRQWKINLVERSNPEWRDLSAEW